MKIAFCLFNYFPYGGLQRDFMRIARLCQDRGHEVHVYTMKWEGQPEPGFQLHLLETQAWQNHSRFHSFASEAKAQLDLLKPDVVVGFNKMPHLDIYYAADVCYQARVGKSRSWFYRLLPRYRRLIELEKSIFAEGKKTEILFIAPQQQAEFIQHYQTEAKRFHLLPPGISRDRIAPANADQIRNEMRRYYHLNEDDNLLLMVGSGFKTKGLDRAIHALAALPPHLKAKTKLFVLGDDKPAAFQALAKKLYLASQIHFLGGRDDVRNFFLAADLLIHPAYFESAGAVLLEALVSGLPVLTVQTCGYAPYIEQANAGKVLPSPFKQAELNTALQDMLLSTQRQIWQQNGLAFANKADIYSLPQKAVDFIEKFGQTRVSR
jgi:UDP-glucose:(heptosyl)LPS alpha-1,3-glucosyltransferase